MKRIPWFEQFGTAARVLVGVVLCSSGYLKLMSPPEELALVIESYQMVPISIAWLLARSLPWVELLVGVCMVLGYFIRTNVVLAVCLLSLFVLALASSALRGIDVANCGCFGQGGPSLSRAQAIVLDFFLLGLSCFAWFSRAEWLSLDRVLSRFDNARRK